MEVTTSSIICWIRTKVEWCDIVLDCRVTFDNNNMGVCEWKWVCQIPRGSHLASYLGQLPNLGQNKFEEQCSVVLL